LQAFFCWTSRAATSRIETCNILTVYDRLLGTYTRAERAHSVIYGLDDVDPVRSGSFPGLLSMPFANAKSARPETRSKSVAPAARVASHQ